MRRSSTVHASRSDRRFLPRLEALESRWCPSAAGIAQNGHTLVIQGDSAGDTVTVSDNGQGGITASIVLAGGTKSKTASGITAIKIDGGSGNDTINYSLSAALSEQESLTLNLGSGNNQATLDFSQGLSKGELAVVVNGGSGNEQLTTNFGAVADSRVNLTENLGATSGSTSQVNFGGALSASDATVTINGGKGADKVTSQLGDVSHSNIQFYTYLGAGANSFNLQAAGSLQDAVVHYDIDAGADGNAVTFNADGVNLDTTSRLNLQSCTGAGADNITVNYSGVMDGELDVTPQLGAGDDTINDTLTLGQGSTGRVIGLVYGGSGSDTVTYDVYDNSNPGGKSTLALLDAVLYEGKGNDTVKTTPNVKVVK